MNKRRLKPNYSLTEFFAVDHLTDGGVLQKSNITYFQETPESTFKPSIWITMRAFAAGHFTNAKRTQPLGITQNIYEMNERAFMAFKQFNSLVRIVTNRVIFIDQRVWCARFTEEIDGILNMIVTVDDFHSTFLL